MMKKTSLLRKTPMKRGKKPERTPKGTTPIERMLGEGLIQRASTFKAKPKPLKKRAASNPGWWDVALKIWEERMHFCEVYGTPLGDDPKPIFFSHLLPRGSYRKYKRDKRNIVLKSERAHEYWHKYGPNGLAHLPEWEAICALYYRLRDEANGIEA
jgi:hypothetical protein